MTIKNLTKTTAHVESGDSGGIVYTRFDAKNIPCGVISGHSGSSSLYTKAVNAVNVMNIYPY